MSDCEPPPSKRVKKSLKEHETIQGLYIIEDFIDLEEENRLLAFFDRQKWDNTLKRRVQHYGYKYDYTFRKIDQTMQVEPLPDCSASIAKRISELRNDKEELLIGKDGKVQPIDQLIVNEYEPGQGISAHIDCKPCFLDGISSLSLGSDSVMQFRRIGLPNVDLPLLRRSLIILTREARFNWTHSIAARTEDNGVKRKRRISMTFRSVILS